MYDLLCKFGRGLFSTALKEAKQSALSFICERTSPSLAVGNFRRQVYPRQPPHSECSSYDKKCQKQHTPVQPKPEFVVLKNLAPVRVV